MYLNCVEGQYIHTIIEFNEKITDSFLSSCVSRKAEPPLYIHTSITKYFLVFVDQNVFSKKNPPLKPKVW